MTPQPFTDTELQTAAKRYERQVDFEEHRGETPSHLGNIGLYDAMARALKYNLDSRVERMELALRTSESELARYDMLPQVVARANYDGRSRDAGGVSRSLITGRETLSPSTSSERNRVHGDIQLTWDILDFGLSYVRAKQASDEVLIAAERKRKIVNRIIEDVRVAYWRAVSGERLLERTRALEAEVEDNLMKSRAQRSSGLVAPMTPLLHQRELLSIRREVQELDRNLRLAKVQLAALMNLRPGVDFDLVLPAMDDLPERFELTFDQSLKTALMHRPELREVAYRRRINQGEEKAIDLELLPNVKTFLGINYDSNQLLYNNNWVGWGVHLSMNLMNVFSHGARQDKVAAQDRLLEARERALTMAIMTQIQVGLMRYEHLRRELTTAREFLAVQSDVLAQTEASNAAGVSTKQTLVRERMNTLVAEVKHDIVYADLENAYANVYAAIGLDPFANDVRGDESIEELAASFRRLWQARAKRS